MGRARRRIRGKRLRSGIRLTLLLLLCLSVGISVGYARVALCNSAVTVTAPFRPQYSANETPQSSLDLAAEITGIQAFRTRYGTTGLGQKIALIDSGVDLGHSAFDHDAAFGRKVGAYYDYTSEGILYTEAVQYERGRLSVGGALYQIGGIYNHRDTFYMAFLELENLITYLPDQVGKKIAVLVTATDENYNCVYLDTNQNCDFTDETPLFCYQNGGDYVTLHQTGYPLHLVLTELAADGSWVQLSTDTLGHGTFLASMLAANSEAYTGLVPQAQLYVYKIFDKNGSSSQMMLADAIEQAIQDDVDCINLSLSVPKDELILPALSAALRKATAANIPVVAAAGNQGPGKDTIAYPARETSVIGVGSYAHPAQYMLDRAIYLEESVIAEYSGRGSISGSVAPWLVAPSGVIAAVPGWYAEQYMYDYGTSISAAMVTAAVTHIEQWAKTYNGALAEYRTLTLEQLNSLLATWAKDLGVTASEQGYGALAMGSMPTQFNHLSMPDLRKTVPTIYQFPVKILDTERESNPYNELYWNFAVPQGKAQSWYLMVPDDTNLLEVTLVVDTQQPTTPFEHLIANGRCRFYLYNPEGSLVDVSDYLGAAYGVKLQTTQTLRVRFPKEGVWELVVASADNLSLYHHFESYGIIKAEIR